MAVKAYHETMPQVITIDDGAFPQISAHDKIGQPAPSGDVGASQVLAQLGFGKAKIQQWLKASRRNGSLIDDEILAEGYVQEDAFYGAIARSLRLPYAPEIDPTVIHYKSDLDKQLQNPRVIRTYGKSQYSKLYIVPDLGRLRSIHQQLTRSPYLRNNLFITSRSAVRKAIWTAGAQSRSDHAINALSREHPKASAKTVLHGKQVFCFGIIFGTFAVAWVTSISFVFIAAHIFCSTLYFCANALRLLALMPRFQLRKSKLSLLESDSVMPTYSVLVPLHHESVVIPQLLKSLDALEWPKSKLDIKIICEADDEHTLHALSSIKLASCIEVVRVPPSLPRTKPKALQYALPAARGQFLTIYDAEDRPHPQQLMEAYSCFLNGPEQLACLQAPLVITNIKSSWLSGLFAVEYAALFRRILPMLAANRFPLPLGGTSNHFKTAILRKVGGWDPFNVTEDADLGIRLNREQYLTGTINAPTLEDAPTDPSIWLKQRSRWFKGWMKTWLVMMREPIVTFKQLGPTAFIASQLLIFGMLISALFHPFIVGYLISAVFALIQSGPAELSWLDIGLFALDAANIFASYMIFLLAARSSMLPLERARLGLHWLKTPIYWFMLSLAAWKAVWELRKDPFHWNKTPHTPSS